MSDEQPSDKPTRHVLSDAERLKLLEDNVIDYAIFMVDTEERVASWNAGAERILGYSEAEIVGQEVALIFTPEDRSSGAEQAEFRIAREKGHSEDEKWHLRKDGSRFWALGILTALYDAQGHLRGYAKILRDFTQRKQHEERIEALNVRLEWAMTETHHRVKNNLQLISAMIDIQSVGRGDSVPVKEYQRLSGQVRALAAVHDLLTADTKAGGDATVISLSDLLETLFSLLRSTEGMYRIETELEEIQVSTGQGSSIALIVNELLTNAVKHANGKVRITLSAQEGNLSLEVYDDGPGFPEGFQANRSATAGLELVEQLTRLDLRGAVRYANLPQGGSCVTVIFPAIDGMANERRHDIDAGRS